MQRRFFLAGTTASVWCYPAFAQNDALRAAFEAMPEMQRRFVQVELQLMDLYAGNLDMQFGPMTRRALVEAAEIISARTGGEMVFDLDNPADADRYLSMMAQEQFMFIYDDGYEG